MPRDKPAPWEELALRAARDAPLLPVALPRTLVPAQARVKLARPGKTPQAVRARAQALKRAPGPLARMREKRLRFARDS